MRQNCIINLLRYLGFYVSWSKVASPSQTATFLGIIIDTVNLELGLPEGKVLKTLEMLKKVDGCKNIWVGGRTFCRRLYNLHKVALQKRLKIIRLNSEAQADVSWWLRFIRVFNGRSTIKKPVHEFDMISDSSRLGYGAHLGNDWLYGAWDQNDMFNSECKHLCENQPELSDSDKVNINVLELWPVIMGVQRWGHKMAGKSVNVVVDNLQVLYMLKTGHSINSKCMEWLRDLFWSCVYHDLDLKPVYIKSEENVLADTLSRVLYSSTASRLHEILNDYSICCKDGVLSFFREHFGAAHRVQNSADEEVGSSVYLEE